MRLRDGEGCSVEAEQHLCIPCSDFFCQWLPGLVAVIVLDLVPWTKTKPLLLPHDLSPTAHSPTAQVPVTLVLLAWPPNKSRMWWSWVRGTDTWWSLTGVGFTLLPLPPSSCAKLFLQVSPFDQASTRGSGKLRAIVLWVCRGRILRTETVHGGNLGQVWQWDFWDACLTCSDGLKTSNWAESHAPGRENDKLLKWGQGEVAQCLQWKQVYELLSRISQGELEEFRHLCWNIFHTHPTFLTYHRPLTSHSGGCKSLPTGLPVPVLSGSFPPRNMDLNLPVQLYSSVLPSEHAVLQPRQTTHSSHPVLFHLQPLLVCFSLCLILLPCK